MPVFDIAAKQGVRLADHTTKHHAAYIGDNHEVAEDNLSKTAYLSMGEWMFVSLRAPELRNIPVFFRAQNSQDVFSHSSPQTAIVQDAPSGDYSLSFLHLN